MGIIRAEPRVASPTGRPSRVGAVWRAFDLQLATYAGLLACDRAGHGLHQQRRERRDRRSTAGPVFTRGLMWAGIAHRVFLVATAFDYRWLKTLRLADLRASSSACSSLTLAIGGGVGGSPAGSILGPFSSSSASSPRS